MICFRDMTFCIHPDCTCDPERQLTDEVREAARKWWGSDDAPISMGYICKPKEDVR